MLYLMTMISVYLGVRPPRLEGADGIGIKTSRKSGKGAFWIDKLYKQISNKIVYITCALSLSIIGTVGTAELNQF